MSQVPSVSLRQMHKVLRGGGEREEQFVAWSEMNRS